MQAVLFDWDGTIADTWAAHETAARDALRGVRGEEPTEGDIRAFLLAPDEASSGLSQAEFLQVWQVMQPLYRAQQGKVQAFPGMEEALSALRERGFALAVVTSKRRWAVSAELRSLGLLGEFDAVVCREDTRRHKPEPQPLLLAKRKLGVDGAVFVGDACTDLKAARAAGMPAVGVAWGWDGSARLMGERPDALCGRVRDIPQVIDQVERLERLTGGRGLG